MPPPTSLKPIMVRTARLEDESMERRGQRVRTAFGSGGGACSCLTVHELRTDGTVSGGTFDLDVEIREADGTLTTESITGIDWDTSAADLKTALVGHSKIASADIDVRGGNFPFANLYIVFRYTGALNRHQEPPVPDSTSITGGGKVKSAQVTSVDWETGL